MCFTSTSTTSSQPNSQVLGDYQNLINQAQGVGNSLSTLPAQQVAQINPQQELGFAGINAAAGTAAPYFAAGSSALQGGLGTVSGGLNYLPGAASAIGAGASTIGAGTGAVGAGLGTLSSALPYYGQAASQANQAAVNPITSGQISQYMSPYTQDVVNATQAEFNNQNAIQANQLTGSAIMGGNAFGGDRAGVAQGVLAGQQQAAQAPVIAGLENTGYTNAVTAAEAEQGIGLQAAGALSNIGAGTAGVGSAQGTLGGQLGSLGSQLGNLGTQYAGLGSVAGSLGSQQAGIGSQIASLGPAATNTQLGVAGAELGAGTAAQQTQQATMNAQYQQLLNQYGVTGLGFEAPIVEGTGSLTGGTSATQSTPSLFSVLSDRRAKENIKKIGKLYDGQAIYRFNYKGDRTTRIGLMAQDVEHEHPDAVNEISGLKTVDYDAATRDAAKKKHFASGGRYDSGGGVSSDDPSLVGYDALSNMLMGAQRDNQIAAGLLHLASGGPANFGVNIMSGAPGPATIPGLQLPGSGGGPPKPAPPQQPSGGLISMASKVNDLSKLFGGKGLGSLFGGGTNAPISVGDYSMPRIGSGFSDAAPATTLGDAGTAAAAPAVADAAPLAAGADAGGLGLGTIGLRNGGRMRGFADGGDTDTLDPPSTGLGGLTPEQMQAIANSPSISPDDKVPLPRPRPESAGLGALADANAAVPDNSASALTALQHSIYGQESGYGRNSSTSATGARGPMQIEPGTFAQYAQPGERIDNPTDNKNVGDRIVADYYNKYGGDPARAAVAYYSGPGNVAPPGSPTPWIRDISHDSNGRPIPSVSTYVSSVVGRMGGNPDGLPAEITGGSSPGLAFAGASGQQQPAQPAGTIGKPDITQAIIAGLGGMFSGHGIIGGGVAAGLGNLQQQKQELREEANTDVAAKRLAEEAKFHQEQIKNMSGHLDLAKQTAGIAERRENTAEDREKADALVRARTAAQPFVVNEVQTMNGPQKIYGVNGPNGTILDPITRKPIDMNGIPGVAPTKIDPSKLPPGVDPVTGIDPKTGRNEGYLQGKTPEEAAYIKSIADYQRDPRLVGYKQKTGLQTAIAAYDPTYRDDIYPQIKEVETAFNKGKQGDQVRFFNNSIQHLGTLEEYAKAMNNGDVQGMNRLKNFFQTQLGVAAPNTFDALKDIVGMEVVKSIVANGGGEGERQAVAKKLAAYTSPAQILDLTNGYKELGAAQLRDMKLQYENGTYHKRNDFEDKLTPESKAELEKYMTKVTARQAAPEHSAPKEGERKQFKQGWGVFRNGQWTPEKP